MVWETGEDFLFSLENELYSAKTTKNKKGRFVDRLIEVSSWKTYHWKLTKSVKNKHELAAS